MKMRRRYCKRPKLYDYPVKLVLCCTKITPSNIGDAIADREILRMILDKAIRYQLINMKCHYHGMPPNLHGECRENVIADRRIVFMTVPVDDGKVRLCIVKWDGEKMCEEYEPRPNTTTFIADTKMVLKKIIHRELLEEVYKDVMDAVEGFRLKKEIKCSKSSGNQNGGE